MYMHTCRHEDMHKYTSTYKHIYFVIYTCMCMYMYVCTYVTGWGRFPWDSVSCSQHLKGAGGPRFFRYFPASSLPSLNPKPWIAVQRLLQAICSLGARPKVKAVQLAHNSRTKHAAAWSSLAPAELSSWALQAAWYSKPKRFSHSLPTYPEALNTSAPRTLNPELWTSDALHPKLRKSQTLQPWSPKPSTLRPLGLQP